MANYSKSESYSGVDRSSSPVPGWVRLGLIAAGSALAGGVAAAWWYRKTLNRLQQSGEMDGNPDFRIPAEARDDED